METKGGEKTGLAKNALWAERKKREGHGNKKKKGKERRGTDSIPRSSKPVTDRGLWGGKKMGGGG